MRLQFARTNVHFALAREELLITGTDRVRFGILEIEFHGIGSDFCLETVRKSDVLEQLSKCSSMDKHKNKFLVPIGIDQRMRK